MPINSIVVAACLEWMSRHLAGPLPLASVLPAAPRWATLRRASEAKEAGHSYMGTEHLLLAAFANVSSQSATVLASLGVSEGAARAMIDKVLRGKEKVPPVDRIVPTSRVKMVIEIAFKLCSAAGQPRVSTGHILLALSTEGQGIAAHVLNDLGASKDHIESALDQVLQPEP